jgi:hypothetical protein
MTRFNIRGTGKTLFVMDAIRAERFWFHIKTAAIQQGKSHSLREWLRLHVQSWPPESRTSDLEGVGRSCFVLKVKPEKD